MGWNDAARATQRAKVKLNHFIDNWYTAEISFNANLISWQPAAVKRFSGAKDRIMSPAGKEMSSLEGEVSEDTVWTKYFLFKNWKNFISAILSSFWKDTWWWAMEFKIKRVFFFNYSLSAGPSTVIF